MSQAATPSRDLAIDTGSPPARDVRVRLWPAVLIVAVQWLAPVVATWLSPNSMVQFSAMMWSPLAGPALVVLWWLAASRVPWRDRAWGLVVFLAAAAIAWLCFHPSFGMLAVVFFALPAITTAAIGWLLVTPFLHWPVRRLGLVAAVVLGWGYFTLVRLDGTDGNFSADFNYRWQPTPEEQFLASITDKRPDPAAPTASADATEPLALEPGDWPCFRGLARNSRLAGVTIATDWKQRPPREIWRHRVGPGWSSFAVVGDRLYTQEQRGEDEAVVCYDAETGLERWSHLDRERFSEIIAGPGPRATPTFHAGRIYAQGAAGRLNCLDAQTGRPVWTRNIASDSGGKVPEWGFASSPLVEQGVVTVFAGAPEGKSVLGYDAETGAPVWSSGEGTHGYCSTQLARLAGADQLLISTDVGLAAFEPARGEVLWHYDWPMPQNAARVIQPAVLDESDVLIGASFGVGTRRIRVAQTENGWTASEVWTSRAIKPYYNDLVLHDGFLYGFDGNFLVCVSLADGKGKWRARGYGNGQILLLADHAILLALTETGEVALVEAAPARHKELCRIAALQGKTWNHPVIAHGRLFVRNGEEAACFELPLQGEDVSEGK